MTDSITLQHRKAGFDEFIDERMPVLYDFSQRLGFTNPELLLTQPIALLRPVSEWLSAQNVADEERVWIATRMGYYIGELLATEYSGTWHVCEANTSRYWGRYVVGDFASFSNRNSIIDPFEAAIDLVGQPPGRSLEQLIFEIVAALRAA